MRSGKSSSPEREHALNSEGSKASTIASPLLESVTTPPGIRIASCDSFSCVIHKRPEIHRSFTPLAPISLTNAPTASGTTVSSTLDFIA
jgi:hypothetical protein